ncbi:hypothetical protein, partial [Salmonella enterica]|uniref:hypothetical protein n=1 Tax=Salmonella enterica TaxID=28901 RepID=UPI001C389BFA
PPLAAMTPAINIILNVLRMSFPSLPQRVGHSATLPQNFWQRLGVTTKERSSVPGGFLRGVGRHRGVNVSHHPLL